MNAATEFDVGPLTWVKSEIDLALERAAQALQQYAASGTAAADGAGDLTQIRFARTHLHQVQGALTIVGLDGVTQFAEALEFLLEDAEQQKLPADAALLALVHRALETTRHYLDDLVGGHPNQPLRLLPLYREVQAARGQARVSATDLFFPDLSARPPRRPANLQAMAHDDFLKMLRQERARFQRGLLAWLRAPQERDGVDQMLDAVKLIEATQEAAAARSFWWVATGFLSALAEGKLPAETDVKQLCARIDLQIRRLAEGSRNVAERLMRDALYFVANADSDSAAVQQVKTAYRLQEAIPSAAPLIPAPQESARRRLREIIAATEEAWNRFCAGSAQALPQFRENAGALSHTVEQLGHTDYRRLAQAIAAAANWLADQPTRQSEALAMEVATAILLAQNAQENFQHLGGDFAHQVDVMVARIHGCIAENPPLPGSEVPSLDEMSRQAQEKLLIGQVAREIQSNLAQIEQVLDGFFRDAERRGDLASLDVPVRQVIGALTVMRHDGAVDALRECAAEIKQFAAPDYQPAEADFERVADRLSMLGFFIDSLQHGASDFAAFARQMRGGPADEAVAAEEEDDEAATSVEQEVEQQKREAQALLSALREQPSDAGLREELRQNLTALQKDADLVADKALGQQAKAMLTALNAEDTAAAPHDLGFADLMPQAPLTPQPSAETLQLSLSSNEEIDAELLSIFLEEAHEVLGAIAENLQVLHRQPHDGDVLTNIRRAFHTLKGSGRMVGLRDLGEAAWAVEQTLNQWLRQERAVGAPLFDLLEQALTVFTQWVAHLEQGGPLPDAGAMTALAERLRNGDGTPPAAPVDAPATVPEAPAAAHSAEIITLEFPPPPATTGSDAEAAAVDTEADNAADEALDGDEAIEPLDLDALPEFDAVAEPGAHAPAAADAPPLAASPDAAHAFATNDGNDPIAFDGAPAGTTADAEFSFDLAVPDAAPPPAAPPARAAEGAQPRISVSPTLYEIFLEEARTHLATLQREFAVIETELHTPTPHEMYRAAHTLGGIAGTVGLTPINRLGLALEHALLRRDHATHPGSVEAREVIRQTIAQIELMLAAVAEKREPEGAPYLIDALDGLFPAPVVDAGDSARATEAPAPEAEAPAAASAAALPPAGAFTIAPPQLQDELDEQLLPIFLEEAVDLGREITAQLRVWCEAPADDAAPRTLARLLHTLKGSARMAGAMNLGEITHAIESRVGLVQAAGATREQIEEIDNAFDAVAQIIDRLENGEALDTPPAETAAAEAPAAPTAAVEAGAQNVPSAPEHPTPAAAEERRQGDRIHGESEGEGTTQRAMLRVRAELIDRLVNEAGELSIARARIEGEMRGLKESLLDLTENVIRLRRQLRDIEIQAELQMQSRTAQTDEHHAGFDPLEFDRFTRFQELTRMMAESVNDVATVQQNLLKNLDDANAAILAQARLNREVQQELMSVRMVPFGSVADRLYRVVRQTAKELGKRANLDIRGGQLELDRSVLEKIAAPLEHLLRNAVAHGLETREVRQARNKPEIGEITLQLEQEGNEIILNFTDDGGGLDLERIRARGVEAGLLSAEEADGADASRLSELIFTPGFSTAREISQVAGRGVGTDVVKTEVAALGGRVEVLSTAGQGTTFRLYIPLTLAVTKALLVRTGSRRYAIPSVMIEQVLDLKEAALTRIREAGAAEWMGNRYPFHFLPHLLGDAQALPEMHRQYWILLLRSGAQRIAVQVDELKGNQEIVVKNIGPQLARVIGIDGATVLGDGQVVLILNPVALSSQPRAQVATAPVPTAQAAPAGQSGAAALPTVMVVDDSMTVRKITGRLLDREGYQVMLAKDGVDALEQMLETVPDVLLVDIEMPRMDGFDFTRNVRADARLKDIPIVMITSRTADKHRNYAFEIGVNQYLGKPYQEDELLGFVAGYVKQRRPA
ncbi:MAG: hybrid sensor histidine kinase/response regulator [Candidatus Accumulibacter sp. 66-26]|nr:Hpt domain-containing protein [Accumulibacter sp.]OJW49400.1 MAG: hybrid sensor histidine kinase/response regulator [Candidatus Accumulibacter sp. 66-26]